MNQNETLRAALQALLDMYLAGANSGDWGNWDVESEPQVIAARAALAQPAAPDRWNEGFKYGQWLAKHSAPVVERADSATPVVERGAGNLSDNAQPAASGEPVAHVPAGPEAEAATDAKLGLVLLPPIRVDRATHAALQELARARGLIVQAIVRERLAPYAVPDATAQPAPARVPLRGLRPCVLRG